MEPFAPRPTGASVREVTLTGKLLPWGDDDQVVLIHMSACDDYFLPVFSTRDKLEATLGRAGVRFVKIKHVDDGAVFLASLPYLYGDGKRALRIILDPTFGRDGTVRFTEIQRSQGDA